MNDRRGFLFDTLALILGTALAGPDEDEFVLDCGCLWCGGRRWGRHSVLAFTIYVERRRPDGVMLRRMVPTELLRGRLWEVGVPVEFDGDSLYPALIGTSVVGPVQLHQRMEQIMSGGEWTGFYVDPNTSEWGTLRSGM